METIKRKISLEDSTDRTYGSQNWGVVTATTFYLNILLTQNVDDMGLFIDEPFISAETTTGNVDYTILIDKLQYLGYDFPFMNGIQPQSLGNIDGTDKYTLRLTGTNETNHYNFGNLPITGLTDSKIEDVRSYDAANPFRLNFNTSIETYLNYNNSTVVGVDRIKSMGNPKIYVFDTKNDINLGTDNQISGIQYRDYSGNTNNVGIVPITTFRFIGEGWNETNISLSALTKEEYLFGIISPPEVQSDIFIDRGSTSVLDKHLRLSEIKNISELTRYGNGFYKINKQ